MFGLMKKWCALFMSILMLVTSIAPTMAIKTRLDDQFSVALPPSTFKAPLSDYCANKPIQGNQISPETSDEGAFTAHLKCRNFTPDTEKDTLPTYALLLTSLYYSFISGMNFTYNHPFQALMLCLVMQGSFFKGSALKVPGAAAVEVTNLNQNLTFYLNETELPLKPLVISEPFVPFYIPTYYNISLTLGDSRTGNISSRGMTTLQPSFLGGVWHVFGELSLANILTDKFILSRSSNIYNSILIYPKVDSVSTGQIADGVIQITLIPVPNMLTSTKGDTSLSTQSSSTITTPTTKLTPSTTTTASTPLASTPFATRPSSTTNAVTTLSGSTISLRSNSNENSPLSTSSFGATAIFNTANGTTAEKSTTSTDFLFTTFSPTILLTSLVAFGNSTTDSTINAAIGGGAAGGFIITTAGVLIFIGYKRNWCGHRDPSSHAEDKLEKGKGSEMGMVSARSPESERVLEATGQRGQYGAHGLYMRPPAPHTPQTMELKAQGVYTKPPTSGALQGHYIDPSAPFSLDDDRQIGPLGGYDLIPQRGGQGGLSKQYINCDAPLS